MVCHIFMWLHVMQGCLQIYFKIGKQKMQAIASSHSKRTKCKYPEAIHHGLRCTWSTSQEWKDYAMKYYGGKLRCHSSWCRCPTPLLYNSRLIVAGKIKGVEVLSVVNAHDMSLIWMNYRKPCAKEVAHHMFYSKWCSPHNKQCNFCWWKIWKIITNSFLLIITMKYRILTIKALNNFPIKIYGKHNLSNFPWSKLPIPPVLINKMGEFQVLMSNCNALFIVSNFP